MATISPFEYMLGASMKLSFVAAEVNLTSQGTFSFADMTVCTLMPPFFLPVLGWRPTPLKIRFEKRDMVVESMILRRFIHSSVPLLRLAETCVHLLMLYYMG